MTNEPNGDSTDLPMIELFRIEIENNASTLGRELLNAETDPSPGRFERLMRAAHSVKGAARIVGLDLAVTLAHAMEDVLSTAGQGKLTLTPAGIDLLLHAHDVFNHLAEVPAAAIPAQLQEQKNVIDALSSALRDMLPRPAPPGGADAEGPRSGPVGAGRDGMGSARAESAGAEGTPPAAHSAARIEDGFVRVSADNLNRLLGLGGEFVVQARSLLAFAPSLQRIKDDLRDLIGEVGDAGEAAQTGRSGTIGIQSRIASCMERSERVHARVLRHMDAFADSSGALERLAGQMYDAVLASRMRPLAEGLRGLPRMVRDLSRELGKDVRLEIQGESTAVDRDVLEKMEAPLTHILRNAVDHGIEPPEARGVSGKPTQGVILLAAEHRAGALHIAVSDDGRGIDKEAIRRRVVAQGRMTETLAAGLGEAELLDFLFLPGFTTAHRVTEVSGRGVGLDVVLSSVREVGGAVSLETEPGKGTTVRLRLPLTLSVVRVLLVEIGGEPFALPLSRIDRLVQVAREQIETIEDRQCFRLDDEHVGLVNAAEVLRVPGRVPAGPRLNAVLVSDRLSRYALVVDRFLAARDLVAIPLEGRLGKIPNVSAGAVMEDGAPLLILDVDDVVRTVDRLVTRAKPSKTAEEQSEKPVTGKCVLVVDDSLTVREVERKLLTQAGYAVTVAVDGMDAWNVLLNGHFDLVVTDVDMPRMHGLDLVRKIRAYAPLRDLPVLIVSYKDREEDRLNGLEAGANGYLTKSSFHDLSLVRAAQDLIGEP